MRRLSTVAVVGLLLLAVAAPASAKTFGTIWIEGEEYRTFGNAANVPDGTGTDPIVAFTNFQDDSVAKFAPGRDSHGGRWAVYMATWTNLEAVRPLTDYDEVLAEEQAGNLSLTRIPEADFRCPVLPARGNGHS